MNNITIKGRLCADPEMRETIGGVALCNFTVAVDRAHNREETDFFRCTAWRKTAEFIKQHFVKGQEILLTGAMRCDIWEDEDGETRSAWGLQVDNVEFCGSAAQKDKPTDKANSPRYTGKKF